MRLCSINKKKNEFEMLRSKSYTKSDSTSCGLFQCWQFSKCRQTNNFEFFQNYDLRKLLLKYGLAI